jgi:hypothetical protein
MEDSSTGHSSRRRSTRMAHRSDGSHSRDGYLAIRFPPPYSISILKSCQDGKIGCGEEITGGTVGRSMFGVSAEGMGLVGEPV